MISICARASEDFPAPDGPMIPKSSQGAISKSAPRTTGVVPPGATIAARSTVIRPSGAGSAMPPSVGAASSVRFSRP